MISRLLFHLFSLPALSYAASISIYYESAVLDARSCVEYCIAGSESGLGHLNLGQALGCNDDSCLCRGDLRPKASDYLSSCIFTDSPSCSDSYDYMDAVSIYDNYCSFTGPATVTAEATQTDSNPSVNSIVTVTETRLTSGPTVTVSSSSSSFKQPTSSGEFAFTLLVVLAISTVAFAAFQY